MPGAAAFSGSRLDFLQAHRAQYAQALSSKSHQDFQFNFNRRYFKRYPITLPHTEEPSSEHLVAVNDDAVDVEEDLSSLTDEERAERGKAIKKCQAKIIRWFQYEHKKTAAGGVATTTKSIHNLLFERLLGNTIKPPRKVPAFEFFAKDWKGLLDPLMNDAIVGQDSSRHLTVRAAIKSKHFNLLSASEQQPYNTMADEAHRTSLQDHKKQQETPYSKLPADRAQAIQALPGFLQPLLDQISLATGMKVYICLGGPEPVYGGNLGMITMYSSVLPTDPYRLNFKGHCGAAYSDTVGQLFMDYLCKCFSPEDCAASALPSESDNSSLVFSATSLSQMMHTLSGNSDVTLPETTKEPTSPTVLSNSTNHPFPSRPSSPITAPLDVSLGSANLKLPAELSLERDLSLNQVPRPFLPGTIPIAGGPTSTPSFSRLHRIPRISSEPPDPTSGKDVNGNEFSPSSYNPRTSFGPSSPPSGHLIGHDYEGPTFEDTFAEVLSNLNTNRETGTLNVIESDESNAAKRKKGGTGNRPTKKKKTVPSSTAPSSDKLPVPNAPRERPRPRQLKAASNASIPFGPIAVKKLATSAQLNLPLTYIPPVDLRGTEPTWVAKAVSYLSAADLGPNWTRLMDVWFEREVLAHWVNKGRVGLKHAPAYLAGWIRSQHTIRGPITASPLLLLLQITEWYGGIQGSRCNELSITTGIHGAYIFLDALYMVGTQIFGKGDFSHESTLWEECVSCITIEITRIISTLPPT